VVPQNASNFAIETLGKAAIQLRTIKREASLFILCTIELFAIEIGDTSQTKEDPMSVNVLYKTQAKATGGRDGHAATLDGALDVKLTTPKELGGGGGAGNNPEQLFAAGYAACFIGAMKFVSSQGGPKVPADASVTSTVGIGPRSEGGFGLEIALEVSLPGLPRADAEALVAKAHQVCPYSNATRNNVDVRLTVA
jgi:lipoyl-dependent peroxiredoxin